MMIETNVYVQSNVFDSIDKLKLELSDTATVTKITFNLSDRTIVLEGSEWNELIEMAKFGYETKRRKGGVLTLFRKVTKE